MQFSQKRWKKFVYINIISIKLYSESSIKFIKVKLGKTDE